MKLVISQYVLGMQPILDVVFEESSLRQRLITVMLEVKYWKLNGFIIVRFIGKSGGVATKDPLEIVRYINLVVVNVE